MFMPRLPMPGLLFMFVLTLSEASSNAILGQPSVDTAAYI